MSEPVHASATSPPRASSGAASIASGLSQATRLLKLSTPLGQDVLLAECVRGEEGLGLGYVFHIAALSLDAANAGSAGSASLGSHTVVIADHNGSFQPNAQASIADSQPGAVMPQDTMDRWRMQLRQQTSGIELCRWDYRTLGARPISAAGAKDGTLADGIRPPTWGFLLSETLRKKLDLRRDQIKLSLQHPRIRINELDSGLWSELGEEPSVYLVEGGVPELPALLNKLLKPIRNDHMALPRFGQWDGNPNESFNDADSDWHSAELRQRSAKTTEKP